MQSELQEIERNRKQSSRNRPSYRNKVDSLTLAEAERQADLPRTYAKKESDTGKDRLEGLVSEDLIVFDTLIAAIDRSIDRVVIQET